MSKVPDDRRSIRTKKMIRIALSQLIEEKGINNISITDLTSRADINRGTFYLHYVDKYDLLGKVESEVMQELKEHVSDTISADVAYISSTNIIDSEIKPMPFMIKIFDYIKDNHKFMKAILGPKGDPIFHTKLKKFIETNLFEKELIKNLRQENMLVPEAYFSSYILSAHLGVIQQWLESGMEKPPEEMALILSRMFFLGPFKVTGLKPNTELFVTSK